MRHRKQTDKLGRTTEHRAAMLSNILASLVDHERVVTTLRIARSARRDADRLVTLAKRNTLHARRQAISCLRPSGDARKATVRKLFDVLGPRYAERPGGYTRIIKLAPRRGDNAPMAILEFVGAELTLKERRRAEEPEEELAVETELASDVQVQAEEQAPAAEEAEAPAAQAGAEAAEAAAAEDETEAAEEAAAPAAAAEEEQSEEREEEPKDRKGGLGRFFRRIIKRDDDAQS
jgi:large subunit ribosomal protein L17